MRNGWVLAAVLAIAVGGFLWMRGTSGASDITSRFTSSSSSGGLDSTRLSNSDYERVSRALGMRHGGSFWNPRGRTNDSDMADRNAEHSYLEQRGEWLDKMHDLRVRYGRRVFGD